MSQLDPVNTSAGDLVYQALRECGALGVGQDPLAEDSVDALARMQWMLQEWERKRWLVYHLVTYSITSTGAQSYTLGPGGQINTATVPAWTLEAMGSISAAGVGYVVGNTINLGHGATLTVTGVNGTGGVTAFSITAGGTFTGNIPSTFAQVSTSAAGLNAAFAQPTWASTTPQAAPAPGARPNRVESAFLRQLVQSQPNLIDYPLEPLQSMEDYNRIALKGLQSFPGCYYYDPGWPLGTIFAYPVPQASIYGLFVSVRETLPQAFATSATKVVLPFEYYSAILYNLAMRLRPKYRIATFPGDPLLGLAKDSLNAIRTGNAQVARLVTPKELARPGIYNIFSDRNY